MLRNRNLFAILLVLSILLTALPWQPAYAQSETVFVEDMEWESELFQRGEHTMSDLVSGPTLAEGSHIRWIDRIGGLPVFASEFYSWLEDNAAVGGALVDPSAAEDFGGRRVYKLTTVTGSSSFTYKSGDSVSDLAYQAAKNDLGNTTSYVSAYAFAVYGAFDRDHPEVFWLSGSSKCGSSIGYSYQKISTTRAVVNYTLDVYFYLIADSFDLRSPDYQDAQVITAAIAQRDADVERILADCPTGSAYEQMLYFNDVLTATNAYNAYVWMGDLEGAADTAWECISALSGSAGYDGPVCEGYARAFKVLCDQKQIPCVLVEGYGNGGDHMWNNVKLGDSWYGVDVTWNDPVDDGNLYAKVSGYETQTWFGLGSTTVIDEVPFAQSHEVENVISSNSLNYVNGPALSETAYEPFVSMDIAPYRSAEGYTAPVKEGYVFAGWYLDEALTQPLPQDQTTGYAFPKFLKTQTLSVKFQTTYGTTAQSEKTDLRLLTSVADLELKRVSFRVSIGAVTQTISSQTVYRQVKSGDTLIENASKIFSEDSSFFVTYTLLEVPQSAFDAVWTVVPCWETMDGTLVEGTARTFQISETY